MLFVKVNRRNGCKVRFYYTLYCSNSSLFLINEVNIYVCVISFFVEKIVYSRKLNSIFFFCYDNYKRITLYFDRQVYFIMIIIIIIMIIIVVSSLTFLYTIYREIMDFLKFI